MILKIILPFSQYMKQGRKDKTQDWKTHRSHLDPDSVTSFTPKNLIQTGL